MIPTLDACKPGIRATGFAMVVAMPPPNDKRGSLFIPDSVADKDQMVEVRGRIVSMSPACFDFANFPPGTAPVIGDVIQFARLSGIQTTGSDGNLYRVIQDRDVLAIVEEAA